jgi:hypothetical protein
MQKIVFEKKSNDIWKLIAIQNIHREKLWLMWIEKNSFGIYQIDHRHFNSNLKHSERKIFFKYFLINLYQKLFIHLFDHEISFILFMKSSKKSNFNQWFQICMNK